MLKLCDTKTIKAVEFLRKKSKNHIAFLDSDGQIEKLEKNKTKLKQSKLT